MKQLAGQIDEAVQAIRAHWNYTPRAGIILGTGLGTVTHQIEKSVAIEYDRIPYFPRSTALAHVGQLVCGHLAGTPVAAMQGRCHIYEGYSAARITFPVRVLKALGIELLMVSNASGGMNPYFKSGDMMIIHDHINLMGDNPLIGINDDHLGPRFPDMSSPYDPELIDEAQKIARREGFVAHRGVYVGVSGPNYETRAEYRFLRGIGGDAVGMSTVPEVIVAAHVGLRVFAVAIVTNVCLPDALNATHGDDVVSAAERAAENLGKMIAGILVYHAPVT